MDSLTFQENLANAAAVEAAREVTELMDLLGLRTTAHLAALLRNPRDDYPSDGLIRTMRAGRQQPSTKFVTLLRARRAEVEDQLHSGLQSLTIADAVQGVYRVTPKRHLITILDEDDCQSAEFRAPEYGGLPTVISATLAVPRDWVKSCDICGKPFLARNTNTRYCYRTEDGVNWCRREAARRRRQAKREVSQWN